MFTTNPQLIALPATLAMFIPAAGAQAASTQPQARNLSSATTRRQMTTHHTSKSTAKYLRYGHNWR